MYDYGRDNYLNTLKYIKKREKTNDKKKFLVIGRKSDFIRR